MPRQTLYNTDLCASSNKLAFGFPSPISADQSAKKPPTSAPTSFKNRHIETQTRPESLQHRRTFTSPENQLLDKWSEDLQQYELILDSMATTSLDNNVKEEIKHVDQWYRYLSETERTATMYALLQHSTPLQNRFFITVLQQLGKKDPVTSLLSPVYTEFGVPQIDPVAKRQTYCERGNGDIQQTNSSNRWSYAFGEQEELSLHCQPYTSFAEAGGVLGSSSSSSSSSGGRRLSDDLLDAPVSHQYSTSASSSNWTHRSMTTGLCTGKQDAPSYSRHAGDRPRSADVSHWSSGLSPSNSNNNNTNHHQHQYTSFLAPITSATPVTPVTPTRLSWHGLPSFTANRFSDPIFCSPDITQKNSKKATAIEYAGPDISEDRLNQWLLYPPSDLASKGGERKFYRQPPHNNKNNNRSHDSAVSLSTHYHPQYPDNATRQPYSSKSSTLPQTTYNSAQRMAPGSRHYNLYDDHQINTTPTEPIGQSGTFHTNNQFTGRQRKDIYHMEQVQIKLLEDIPAWLKSLRLHKYTHLFRSMTWESMIQLSDDDLMEKGVVALGARRKLLKVFDQVKDHCDKNDIKYKSN